MSFGSALRKARVSKGIGLRTMAKALNISPTYLHGIEVKNLEPSKELYLKIADMMCFDKERIREIKREMEYNEFMNSARHRNFLKKIKESLNL